MMFDVPSLAEGVNADFSLLLVLAKGVQHLN